MEQEDQRDEIIEQLHILNKAVAHQNSIWHIFNKSVIYGIGFFFGSAIVATIIFGFVAPFFAEIDWIRELFERGASASK